MCSLSQLTFISSNSVHFLCSNLEAHLFTSYYVPGAVLGPGDRAKNRNPCPSGAQARESTYSMVSSAIEKNETGKGMQDRINSNVLNHVVRENLVRATRVWCVRADTWGSVSHAEGRTRQWS